MCKRVKGAILQFDTIFDLDFDLIFDLDFDLIFDFVCRLLSLIYEF